MERSAPYHGVSFDEACQNVREQKVVIETVGSWQGIKVPASFCVMAGWNLRLRGARPYGVRMNARACVLQRKKFTCADAHGPADSGSPLTQAPAARR